MATVGSGENAHIQKRSQWHNTQGHTSDPDGAAGCCKRAPRIAAAVKKRINRGQK